MFRLITTALLAALIAFNNHWTITVGFIFIILTLEIQGKLLVDILTDVIKIIGKIEKLEGITGNDKEIKS